MSRTPRVAITYEDDEDGRIVASIYRVHGVHSHGRTRAEARTGVLDALDGMIDLRASPDASQLTFHLVERAAQRLAVAAGSPACALQLATSTSW